jgi:hypothetical protein
MVDALFCTISLKDESEKIVKLSSTVRKHLLLYIF